MKIYSVYILSNNSGGFYVGVTSDLDRRISEHKSRLINGFTSKYRHQYLVYFEQCSNADDAIAREKQLKGWTRVKKLALIKTANPMLEDLSQGSFDCAQDDRVVV